jgi:hypothetical protein
MDYSWIFQSKFLYIQGPLQEKKQLPQALTEDRDDDELTILERNILKIAIGKRNYVSRNGTGESLTEEESLVFEYWLKKGKIRAVENSRFGDIYEISG